MKERDIEPQGLFQHHLAEEEGEVWRYPAYAVKHFASMDGKLEEKLRLLCRCRGKNGMEIERNYWNALVEFHALYALTALMRGYQFKEWDAQSRTSSAAPNKNCDLALEKDGKPIFAEVKNLSGDLLSERESKGVVCFEPSPNLGRWLRLKVNEAAEKGADLLVCYDDARLGLPHGDFNEVGIKSYLTRHLPANELSWGNGGRPFWCVPQTSVERVVMLTPSGCFVIQLWAQS